MLVVLANVLWLSYGEIQCTNSNPYQQNLIKKAELKNYFHVLVELQYIKDFGIHPSIRRAILL